MRTTIPVALAALFAIAGCDARATTAAAPARNDLKSRQLESCAASVDCQDGLRCFEQTCRRVDRSTLGDYQAAVAARAEAAGDLEAALAAYGEAQARYGAEKLVVPVELDCAYGAALARGRADRDRAELAARVLHRCLQAAPVGSSLRQAALRQLADLADLGLDPQHLASATPADVFLSKQPAAPRSDALAVAVTGDPPPPARSWPAITGKLTGAELRPALIKCWEAYYAAAKQPALAVTVPIKSRFVADPDFEDEGKFSVALEDPDKATGPDADAAACVRAAIGPALKKAEGVRDSFTTRLVLTIQ
jgi:hypothetical protein